MKHLILLLCVFLGLSSLTAQADWRCNAHNARNQNWTGYGPTRAAASAQVMRICVRNSKYARNCVIDSCSGQGGYGMGYSTGMMYSGGWHCSVANARGQGWTAMGATRADAAAHAMRICANNSRYARNCHILSCSR